MPVVLIRLALSVHGLLPGIRPAGILISIGVQSLSVRKLIGDDFLSLFVSIRASFYYSVFKQGSDAFIEALIPPYDR